MNDLTLPTDLHVIQSRVDAEVRANHDARRLLKQALMALRWCDGRQVNGEYYELMQAIKTCLGSDAP